MCYWVLGFKVHRGPSSPSYFSPGEETRPQITQKNLTTRDGVLSGLLNGSLNTSKSQVPSCSSVPTWWLDTMALRLSSAPTDGWAL